MNFDHTSIAVDDLEHWTKVVKAELGLVLVEEEELPRFRYRIFASRPDGEGSRLELIAPPSDGPPGFVGKFLDTHGVGPHHLTFTVPDVEIWAGLVMDLGFGVVGVDLSTPEWREAFIRPDGVHTMLIQIADSKPGGAATPRFTAGADPGSGSLLRATTVHTTDMDLSRRLFGDVLEGRATRAVTGWDFAWPWGSLQVRARTKPGCGPLLLSGAGDNAVQVGSALFVPVS